MNPTPPFLAIRPGVSFWVEDWVSGRSAATVQAVREGCYVGAVFYDSAGVVWPVVEARVERPAGLLDRLLLWRRVPVTIRFGDGLPEQVREITHRLRAIIESDNGFAWQGSVLPSELAARFDAAQSPAEVIEAARQIE